MARHALILGLPLTLFFQRVVAGGGWSGATWASGLTAASSAVCPASAPIGCSAIQQPDYCCPTGNYCAYDINKAVGCCPYGQTCSGAIGGGGVVTQSTWYAQSTWAPTTSTYWQPSTLYVTTAIPTTTVYGGIIVSQTQQTATQYVQTTTAAQAATIYNGGYCSTLYANGGNLPTTRPGDCGTILVLNAGVRLGSSIAPLTLLAVAMQLLV